MIMKYGDIDNIEKKFISTNIVYFYKNLYATLKANGIYGRPKPMSILKLSFLPKGQKFVATVYTDTKDSDYKTNPQAYSIRKGLVDSRTALKLTSAAGGGYAISLVPATPADVKNLKKL